MNGFFLNQLLPVSTGWIPDPDRDKSGTPHRDKPGGAFEVLENQALQVGCSNQAEREGLSRFASRRFLIPRRAGDPRCENLEKPASC